MIPAPEHVKFAGYTVPIFDEMFGGEIEALETLMRRAERREITDYGYDLECFMLCARFRVPAYRQLSAEDFSQLKFSAATRKSLREKVGVLLVPFVVMQHELNQAKGLELMGQLKPEKMLDAIQTQEIILAQMREMYRAAIGTSSAGDSSAPTA